MKFHCSVTGWGDEALQFLQEPVHTGIRGGELLVLVRLLVGALHDCFQRWK